MLICMLGMCERRFTMICCICMLIDTCTLLHRYLIILYCHDPDYTRYFVPQYLTDIPQNPSNNTVRSRLIIGKYDPQPHNSLQHVIRQLITPSPHCSVNNNHCYWQPSRAATIISHAMSQITNEILPSINSLMSNLLIMR